MTYNEHPSIDDLRFGENDPDFPNYRYEHPSLEDLAQRAADDAAFAHEHAADTGEPPEDYLPPSVTLPAMGRRAMEHVDQRVQKTLQNHPLEGTVFVAPAGSVDWQKINEPAPLTIDVDPRVDGWEELGYLTDDGVTFSIDAAGYPYTPTLTLGAFDEAPEIPEDAKTEQVMMATDSWSRPVYVAPKDVQKLREWITSLVPPEPELPAEPKVVPEVAIVPKWSEQAREQIRAMQAREQIRAMAAATPTPELRLLLDRARRTGGWHIDPELRDLGEFPAIQFTLPNPGRRFVEIVTGQRIPPPVVVRKTDEGWWKATWRDDGAFIAEGSKWLSVVHYAHHVASRRS